MYLALQFEAPFSNSYFEKFFILARGIGLNSTLREVLGDLEGLASQEIGHSICETYEILQDTDILRLANNYFSLTIWCNGFSLLFIDSRTHICQRQNNSQPIQ
jgi:hypothetical protein